MPNSSSMTLEHPPTYQLEQPSTSLFVWPREVVQPNPRQLAEELASADLRLGQDFDRTIRVDPWLQKRLNCGHADVPVVGYAER